METRIRRYFTFRKLDSKPLPSTVIKKDLDLISVPYESTAKSNAPISIFSTRKKENASIKDDLEDFAMRTSPYKSVVAGAPPIFGATPIKGNGPVKLQTSRRLSSGELLTTTQEHNRTLADMRDGEYIVGRKDPNRTSKAISIRLPIRSRPSSPRASFASVPPRSFSNRERSPQPQQLRSSIPKPDPVATDRTAEIIPPPVSKTSPRIRKNRPPSLKRSLLSTPSEIPLPLSPGTPPLSANSLLSRGEEQNATVQALWKAEYARLVNLYGQDGVDRNIAQLNRDHFGQEPEYRMSLEAARRSPSIQGESTLRPSTETVVPPLYWSPRGSITHERPPLVDNTSDESSVKVPSLLSSEESSSYTRRTSIFEAEVPTTREEVSRIVENMRKNYLTAIEAKSEKLTTNRAARAAQRSSYNHPSAFGISTSTTSSKLGRQSWHATTTSNPQKQERHGKKRARSRPKAARGSGGGSSEAADLKASPKANPSLQRADSTTLGSFFSPKKVEPSPPLPLPPAERLTACTPDVSPQEPESPSKRRESRRSVSPMSSSEVHAPETDDFDVFYHDLAQDLGSISSHSKPVIPTIRLPHDEEVVSEPEDAAPPPPNIDCTPRKRSFVGIL